MVTSALQRHVLGAGSCPLNPTAPSNLPKLFPTMFPLSRISPAIATKLKPLSSEPSAPGPAGTQPWAQAPGHTNPLTQLLQVSLSAG